MSLLTPEEGQELLAIAREALRLKVLCNAGYEGRPDHPALIEQGAAFVTLKLEGQLRGCIGHLTATQPLYLAVADCAIAAGSSDPRFPPVVAEDLQRIEFSISVLSSLEPVKDVSEIEVGRHGIYIEKGGLRGVLLPQVAVEMCLDRERFLQLTCRKAGLPADAWQHGAVIRVFSAQIFH